MHLGFERSVLGDILVHEGHAWVFCCRHMTELICRELTQIRRTTVCCTPGEPPAFALEPPEISELVAASERLDAVAAAVWQLSRSEAKALVAGGMVYVDGLVEQNPDASLREGALVSVRGHGRFRYEGPARQTRRGRLRVCVRVYR